MDQGSFVYTMFQCRIHGLHQQTLPSWPNRVTRHCSQLMLNYKLWKQNILLHCAGSRNDCHCVIKSAGSAEQSPLLPTSATYDLAEPGPSCKLDISDIECPLSPCYSSTLRTRYGTPVVEGAFLDSQIWKPTERLGLCSRFIPDCFPSYSKDMLTYMLDDRGVSPNTRHPETEETLLFIYWWYE